MMEFIPQPQSFGSLAYWQNAIHETPKKSFEKWNEVIDHLGQAIGHGLSPQDFGTIVSEVLNLAKPLKAHEYTDLIQRINQQVAHYAADQRGEYHATGWVWERNGELSVRADEVEDEAFWPTLSEKLAPQPDVKVVIIHEKESDAHISPLIARQLAKSRPDPGCFHRKVYCECNDSSKIQEWPEHLVRGLFPALENALSGKAFSRQGQSPEAPLKLNLNLESMQIALDYLESVPRPSLFTLPACDAAVLMELADYGGNLELVSELYGQLDKYLGVSDPYVGNKHSPETVEWFSEFYANTGQSPLRDRINDYFGAALYKIFFRWKMDAAPAKQNFKSIRQLAAGDVQPAARSPRIVKETPPAAFEQLLSLLSQIGLSQLVVKMNAPEWFWKGMGTLGGIPEISLGKTAIHDNEACLAALRQMEPRPKLSFASEAAYKKAVEALPDFSVYLV